MLIFFRNLPGYLNLESFSMSSCGTYVLFLCMSDCPVALCEVRFSSFRAPLSWLRFVQSGNCWSLGGSNSHYSIVMNDDIKPNIPL